MASLRFITAKTTVGQYGSADFTITATGSLAVNDASSCYALNLQGVSGECRKLITDGVISLVTRNAAGTAVLFAAESGEALDGIVLFDLKNPAITVSVDTVDGTETALARGISARDLAVGRDPDFSPAIPGRIEPWRAALTVSATHRNGDAEAAGIAAAGKLEIAALLKGAVTVKAAANTDLKSAVPAASADAVARGLSSIGAMKFAGIDNSFKLTVTASGAAAGSNSATADAYGMLSISTLVVDGDLGGTYTISAFGGGTGDGVARAYGIAGAISVTVGGSLRAVLNVTARSSNRGSANNDALAYGVVGSLFSAAEVADGCRMTVNATAGLGSSAIGKVAAFYINGGLLSVAGRFGGTYKVSAAGGLGGCGAAQAFGIYAAGVAAGVLAGNWTVSAKGGGTNGNVSGFAEAYGVKSTGNITLTGGTDQNYRLSVSATGAIGKDASAAAIGFRYDQAFSSAARFGGAVTVSATGGQATGVADSQSHATAIGVSGGNGALSFASLGGVFNITARSGRDATLAEAFAAGIFANGALSVGAAEKTFAMTVNATSGQSAGFASGIATAAGVRGASLAVAGAWLGTYHINAAGGKGTGAYGEANALRTISGGMSFGTLGGTYLVTARGGAGDGTEGSSSYASATGLNCSGGDFNATLIDAALRFTVNAAAGAGGENANAAATGIYTNKSVNIASGFTANLQVTAIAAKSSGGTAVSEAYGLRFDKAANDVSVTAASIAGMLGGNFAVRATGGSGGDDVIAWCYGIRSATALSIGSIDAKFVLAATATGGTGKQATVVLHGIRSEAALTVAGTVGGTYTITGTGGTGTGGGSANLNMTGISGKTGVTLGDFAATFRMTVTGTAGKGSFLAAAADIRGIDSGAGMTLGDLAGTVAVTANGNGAANATLLEAYGLSARGGGLSTGAWSKSFALTVTVNGQKEYGVNGYGVSASGAVLIENLAGALTVAVNGGSAATGPVGGYGIQAFGGIAIAALELNTFRLTVRSTGGYGRDGSAVASGVRAAGGNLTFHSNAAGNWTVEANARGNNLATMTAASARATAIEAVAGNITIGQALSGTFRVVAAANTSTGDASAQALLVKSSGTVVIANGIGPGSKLTVLAGGGSGEVASALAALFYAGGAMTVTGTLFSTASVSATGGKGGSDSSAAAYGFWSDSTLAIGSFDPAFRLTVSASGGSGRAASATAAGIAGQALTMDTLAGRIEVTARGKNNAGSAAATASGLQADTVTIDAVDAGFYLAVTAIAGNGLDAGATAAGLAGTAALALNGGFAGTLSVNATAGIGTGGAGGSSSARAYGWRNDGGSTESSGLLSGSWTVGAKGGSRSVLANDAEAIGMLAATFTLSRAFDSKFRLTVTAAGGSGAAAFATAAGINASTGNLSVSGTLDGTWNITGRGGSGQSDAAATAAGLSGAADITLGGDASTFKLAVNATGGSGFDASAAAYGFTAGGAFAGGSFDGNYQIKAQGGSGLGNGSPEAAATAAWIDAGSTVSLTAGSKLTVNVAAVAGSAVDADAEAAGIDAAGEVTLNTLDGNWTVAATGGRGTNGSAAAYGIRSGERLAVAAVDPALRMTVTATGGSAYGNTDAWAAGLSGEIVNITAPALGGNWTIMVAAGLGDFSAHAIGAWISSVLDPAQSAEAGTIAISSQLTATVSVTVKGGAGSNAPQSTVGYGIRCGMNFNLSGGVADAFKLTVAVTGSSRYAPSATAWAYGIYCENSGFAISGPIAGVWSISATGGNAAQDGSAGSTGFYLAGGMINMQLGNITSGFMMTVKAAGGSGGSVNATARGVHADSIWTAGFAGQLTVTATGGRGTVLAEAHAYGLSGLTIDDGGFAGRITVSATGGSGLTAAADAAGISASGYFSSAGFSGVIEAAATGGNLSAGSGGDASGTAAGIEAGMDLSLGSFTGGIKAVAKGGSGSGSNHAYAYGLKAGTTLTVSSGVVAGSLSATAAAGARGDATAVGLTATSLDGVTRFAGRITATATGLAAAATAGAWGVKVDDFGGEAITVSGVIAAAGSSRAVGISGNQLNLTVTGVIYAGRNGNADTLANTLLQLWNNQGSVKGYLGDVRNLNGEAIAIRGGSGMDTVKLGAGAMVIGDIDFGAGSDLMMISSGAQLAGSLKVDGNPDTPLAWTYVLDTAASKNAIVTLPGGLDDALQGSSVSVKLETGRIGEYILLEGASGINISINVGGQVIAVGQSGYVYNDVVINYYRKNIGGGRDQLILSVQPAPEPPAATGGNDWGSSAVEDAAGSVAGAASLTLGDGASAPGGAADGLDAGLTSDLDQYAAAAMTELSTLGNEDAARKYGLLAAV